MASWASEVCRRAWADSALWGREPWRVVVFQVLAAAAGAYFSLDFLPPGEAWPTIRNAAVGAIAGMAVASTIFVLLMAICAPARIWKDDQKRIAELQERLRPKLVLHPPPRHDGTIVPHHQLVNSVTGANTDLYASYARVAVYNPSNYAIRGCRAYVSSLEAFGADNMPVNGFRYSDQIQLCPAYHPGEQFFDIEPFGQRFIDVIQTISDGQTKILDRAGMVKYQKLLDSPPLTMRFTVTVFGPETPAQSVRFDLVQMNGRTEIRSTIMAEGNGDDEEWAQDITSGGEGALRRVVVASGSLAQCQSQGERM